MDDLAMRYESFLRGVFTLKRRMVRTIAAAFLLGQAQARHIEEMDIALDPYQRSQAFYPRDDCLVMTGRSFQLCEGEFSCGMADSLGRTLYTIALKSGPDKKRSSAIERFFGIVCSNLICTLDNRPDLIRPEESIVKYLPSLVGMLDGMDPVDLVDEIKDGRCSTVDDHSLVSRIKSMYAYLVNDPDKGVGYILSRHIAAETASLRPDMHNLEKYTSYIPSVAGRTLRDCSADLSDPKRYLVGFRSMCYPN
ncbi:hypothetical protein COT47_02030 [Candidatus Woesearchaeota archaeon CG08_land_8_20_14_0_20_43_7]|nr:MAG: hypothetical protein COT47_02030 [Candidatus Woesearchaeota archaeon CG08_land_8_20_14_0_20_43_7]